MKQLHMVFEEQQKVAILKELLTRLALSVVYHRMLKGFVVTVFTQLNLKLELVLDCEHFSCSQFGFRTLKVPIIAK